MKQWKTMWKREPNQTGLMRVTQGYRKWHYGPPDNAFITITLDENKYKVIFTFADRSKRSLTVRFDDLDEAKRAGRTWFDNNRNRF